MLVSDIPYSYTLESMYRYLPTTTSLAKDWCSIPGSYIGAFQNVSVNTVIAQYNVSDWLPCGGIVLHYHQSAESIITNNTYFKIQVNKQFYVNLSVIESHLENLNMDWHQPTYGFLQQRPNGI